MRKTRPQTYDEMGYIYFIEAGGFVKIGWSRRKPTGRMTILQIGCPFEMRLIGYRRGSRVAELRVHRRFAEWRLRGEWFHLAAPVRAYVGWARNSVQPTTIKSPSTDHHVVGNWLF